MYTTHSPSTVLDPFLPLYILGVILLIGAIVGLIYLIRSRIINTIRGTFSKNYSTPWGRERYRRRTRRHLQYQMNLMHRDALQTQAELYATALKTRSGGNKP